MRLPLSSPLFVVAALGILLTRLCFLGIGAEPGTEGYRRGRRKRGLHQEP